jgi:hypothetical protein
MSTALRKRFTLQSVGLVFLYLGLGVASGLLWARVLSWAPMTPGQPPRLYSWHAEMISGQAFSPNQYRPLTPWMAEALAPLMPRGDVFTAYFVIRSLAVALTLLAFDRYLRRWFSNGAAAAGALCLAAVIPFTYFRVVQESDTINLLVFVAAFWALAYERDDLLIPLVVVGTLNRETALMIPAVYLVARWGLEKPRTLAVRALALVGGWAVIYGGIYAHYGHRAPYTDLSQVRAENFGSWLPTIFAVAFLGALWVLPFLVWRKTPPLLRRSFWLVPPFVALHYLVGVVQEVRLFLPLTPILIPLSWWALFPEARRPEAAAPTAAPAPGRLKARR